MEYTAYKFRFLTGVHFGEGRLETGAFVFGADRLFSALATETLAQGKDAFDNLVDLVQSGKIRFSDAFPFAGNNYFLQRPLLRILRKNTEETIAKRKVLKKLEYLPMTKLSAYLEGRAEPEKLLPPKFGDFTVKTSVAINPDEDPKPYRVGVFSFKEDRGLYVILGYESKKDASFIEDFLDRLSFVGIGGKRSSGLGRFELHFGQMPPEGMKRLTGEYQTYMTLCSALPNDEELALAMEGANYLLEKKSGFVASPNYAPEWRRKRDVYAFKVGSCFRKKFEGQLRDVSSGGKHPVYRYLMPLFMGVE